MRFLLTVVVVVGLTWGGYNFYEYWGTFRDKNKEPEHSAPVQPPVNGADLPGMPPSLQTALDAARARGASGLHDFLTLYANMIADPRRAWIELDYVVLLAESSPGEARAEFAKIKARVPDTSPVYARIKQLEKTYE